MLTKRILLIDDDQELHELVRFVLTRDGYEVVDAYDSFEGLEQLAEGESGNPIGLALLDVMMPRMDGLECLRRLRRTHARLPVIMMTAASTPGTIVEALREQACDFLAKPFDIEALRDAVRAALRLRPQELSIEVLSARPEWIELRVPCDPAAVEPLNRIMTQLNIALPDEMRAQVTLAFREMLRNAIEHGGKNDPTQAVEVGYLHTPRLCLYRIRDPGAGFRVESLCHAAISNPEDDPLRHAHVREELGLRPGGFGILIARNMVDEMIYNERRNEVVLIKYLDPAPAPKSA